MTTKEADRLNKAVEKAKHEISFIFTKLQADISSIVQKEVTFVLETNLLEPPF